MNPASRNGLILGMLAGCLLAWLTWEGSILIAAAAIIVTAAIAWFVGYFLSDKTAG